MDTFSTCDPKELFHPRTMYAVESKIRLSRRLRQTKRLDPVTLGKEMRWRLKTDYFPNGISLDDVHRLIHRVLQERFDVDDFLPDLTNPMLLTVNSDGNLY